jgi:hypothetical protein
LVGEKDMDHSFLSTFKVKCHLILFALVKVKQSVQVVVCVLSKGCLTPTFVRAKQEAGEICRNSNTQMSRNKSIDGDDVDLLQLDVQE